MQTIARIQKPEPRHIPHVQGEYLRFIRDFHKKHRISPSLGELMEASGDTKSTVRTALGQLIRKGFIHRGPSTTRNLMVTQQGHKILRKG